MRFLAKFEVIKYTLALFWAFWLKTFMEIDRNSKKIHFREVSWLFLSVSDSFSKFLRCFKVFREVLR